ncbi:hypothetical protein CRG98_031323 [Punica granatum]|uniref:Uncharacterized protein n=1 Tax=Punica granatum TaxID=22663 RepID=A0A2I0IX06_PUNGR|nr:hypothetical protein CRG98_031323 [Punica granatum]
MAQNNQPANSKENTPPTPVYYQPSMTHALPPSTPAGAPPADSGEIPPLVLTLEAQAPSTFTEGAARIVALEGDISALKGTINQLAADMAEDVRERLVGTRTCRREGGEARGACAGARIPLGWHYSPESDDFARNALIDLKQ